jgi:hypothetical protein
MGEVSIPRPGPRSTRKDSSRLRRRLIGSLLAAAVGLVSAELFSFFALWWLEGQPFAGRSLEARRERLFSAAQERPPGATAESDRPSAATSEAMAAADTWNNLLEDPAHARRMLHPYWGYVYDPALNGSAGRLSSGFPRISDEGFYVVPSARTAGTGPVFTAAIFGGSMAMLMALEGREALVNELAASSVLRGRKLVVRCYALGGYKQPQQLLVLASLLALGEQPDAVINLDGLNELALPYAENRPRGVFPFFPRSWDALVQEAADPAVLELAGKVAYLRVRRLRLAGLFSAPILRHSSAGNLLWRSLDARLQLRIARENLALSRIPSGAHSFAATGPHRDYATEDELFADLVRVWHRSSLQMHRLAAANHIRYYHFLQPNQFDPGAKPIGRVEAARAVDPASPFREPVLRGYPLLSKAGEELRRAGVRFFDLRPLFARIEAPLYVDQCCHVSREGSAILAAAIGKAVREDLDASAPGNWVGGRPAPSRNSR